MTKVTIKNNTYKIRKINESDYYKNYLHVLSQLSSIEPDKISFSDFRDFLNTNNSEIIVIENITDNNIIGSITILKENKLIHNLGTVSHIEDFVIDEKHRKLGLGKLLLNKAIELSQDCYKIILDCSEKNIEYYKKFEFIQKEYQMARYLI